MHQDIESFTDSPIKNQRNDDVWKEISSGRVRFAVTEFGGVALVENDGSVFPLGKPHTENSAKLQGRAAERYDVHGVGHELARKSVDELVYGSAFKSVPKTAIYS
ncbi:MAG: hypothetical protein DKT66_08985 [Candidatus Melainabacteria bacterium]|nr:MAG: hypothetical protein DKT66_08985 [Candidatus Melainabacteria bacterium]